MAKVQLSSEEQTLQYCASLEGIFPSRIVQKICEFAVVPAGYSMMSCGFCEKEIGLSQEMVNSMSYYRNKSSRIRVCSWSCGKMFKETMMCCKCAYDGHVEMIDSKPYCTNYPFQPSCAEKKRLKAEVVRVCEEYKSTVCVYCHGELLDQYGDDEVLTFLDAPLCYWCHSIATSE
jgi:hypothetical protein